MAGADLIARKILCERGLGLWQGGGDRWIVRKGEGAA